MSRLPATALRRLMVIVGLAIVVSMGVRLVEHQTDLRQVEPPIHQPVPGSVGSVGVVSPSTRLPDPRQRLGFDELARLAEAGDPVAQRRLARWYRDCQFYSLSPDRHKQTIVELGRLRDVRETMVESVTARLDARCGEIDGGAPIPADAAELWLELSARNGDLVARAEQLALDPHDVPPEVLDGVLTEAIGSTNPDALLALAPLLGTTSKDRVSPELARFVGSPQDEYAWAVAACRLGAECGPGSYALSTICLGSLYCNYSSYEAFLTTEVLPPGQLERVDEILAFLEGGGPS